MARRKEEEEEEEEEVAAVKMDPAEKSLTDPYGYRWRPFGYIGRCSVAVDSVPTLGPVALWLHQNRPGSVVVGVGGQQVLEVVVVEVMWW